MITRIARPADAVTLAEIMRDAHAEFGVAHEVRRYQRAKKHRVLVTHTREGQVYAVVFCRLLQASRTIFCDALALQGQDLSRTQDVTRSLRGFLAQLLTETQCTGVVVCLHNPTQVYLQQLQAVGFLRQSQCHDCPGGQFMFATTAEHVGNVVLERLLAGNARVFEECSA